MNRPNKKDDPNYPFEFPNTYLSELEKYCDELEANCEEQRDYKEYFKSCYGSIIDENERLADRVDELEKALDKACNILNRDLYCQDCRYKYSKASVCDNCGDGQIGEEKWKQWLMKEEEK